MATLRDVIISWSFSVFTGGEGFLHGGDGAVSEQWTSWEQSKKYETLIKWNFLILISFMKVVGKVYEVLNKKGLETIRRMTK